MVQALDFRHRDDAPSRWRVDGPTIMQEIAGPLIFREGVPKLLGDPSCRTVSGGHMHDASAVREDGQHEQQPERDSRHHEQVGGHHDCRERVLAQMAWAPRLLLHLPRKDVAVTLVM
jgi:hypothetical protein